LQNLAAQLSSTRSPAKLTFTLNLKKQQVRLVVF